MSRRRTAPRNAVSAGSLSENKMNIEEEKGGIKLSNAGGGARGVGLRVYQRLKRNQSDSAVDNRTRSKLEAEKNPIQLRKTRSDSQRNSDENCKLVGCKEKNLKGSLSNVAQIASPKADKDDIPSGGDKEKEEEEEGEEEYEDEEEVEIDKESYDIKEMNAPEEMPKEVGEEEEQLHQIHEIPISSTGEEEEQLHQIPEIPISSTGEEEEQLQQIHEIPISNTVEQKPIPVVENLTINPEFTKPSSVSVAEEYGSMHETQNRMQNLVDLVMWRDISKSALVFGLGTFILVSSSYTKDVNFSFISAISYLGLVYLAAIFFYKSIICRGAVDFVDSEQKYMVLGEEELIWILRKILPYFNEVLFKIRCLFSGDPATTMKLAILLFVLARCGSSITIWTMTRLAFFGVFTLPKFCSTYSNQLSSYDNFWVRRLRDAWDSCTHKKAVALAIFTLLWNLSSVVARIWSVFFLVVAVRFYQQSVVRDEWSAEEVLLQEDLNNGRQGRVRQRAGTSSTVKNGPHPVELTKAKKGS